jgi:hypothetical protein
MQLLIWRKDEQGDRAIGDFFIDGERYYYCLEDKDRFLETGGVKVPKETAIPRGKYRVIIDWSNRFQRSMPHVLDVPQFDGIRIHAGNTPADTEGCILLGMEYDPSQKIILKSKIAFDDFYVKLLSAINKGEEVTLEIT